MSYKFRGVIILEGQDFGAKEVNERRPEGQEGGSTRPLYLAAWAHPIWSSWPQLHRSFAPKHPRDLKTTIKRSPDVFQREAAEKQETRNRETEGYRRRRSEGGNAAGIHLRRAPPPAGVFIINIYSKIVSTPGSSSTSPSSSSSP